MGFLRRRKDPFIASLEPMLRQHAAGAPVHFVEEEGKYLVGEMQVHLTNLRYGWEQREDFERDVWLHTTVRGLFASAIPESLTSDDMDHVLLGIRSRATIEHVRLNKLEKDHADDPGIPVTAITKDLGAVLLWDTPTTMGMINNDTIAAWGRSYDELYQLAIDNLRQLDVTGWAGIENTTFRLLDDDDYAASRLLIPELLDPLPLHGDVVALIPNRSTLIVTAADDPIALTTALDLATQDRDQPSQLSLAPIVGRAASWRPLVLQPDHPGYTAWRHLTRIDAAINAEGTQQPLQQLLGDDLFVASVIVRENDAGVAESICTWANGVPSLLTKADVVALARDEADIRLVEWDRVAATVDHLLEPTTYYPSRYRVLQFPSDDELTAMST